MSLSKCAAICSPPLVLMVAAALKNKEIVITGVVTGISGGDRHLPGHQF
jgi:hypothetical protein